MGASWVAPSGHNATCRNRTKKWILSCAADGACCQASNQAAERGKGPVSFPHSIQLSTLRAIVAIISLALCSCRLTNLTQPAWPPVAVAAQTTVTGQVVHKVTSARHDMLNHAGRIQTRTLDVQLNRQVQAASERFGKAVLTRLDGSASRATSNLTAGWIASCRRPCQLYDNLGIPEAAARRTASAQVRIPADGTRGSRCDAAAHRMCGSSRPSW